MYCRNCGSQIGPNTRFCPDCGASQNDAAHQQPVVHVINNNTNINRNSGGYVHKRKWVAFFLCLFFGYLGVHRFYVGKIGTGIIWLFTAGFLGIGWILDLTVILFGGFKDKAGQRLV